MIRPSPRRTAPPFQLLVGGGGLLSIALLLGLVVAWLGSRSSSGLRIPYSAPDVAVGGPVTAQLGIYLEPADTPATLRLNIVPSALSAESVTTVQQVDQLQAITAATRPQSIWINEAALDTVPQTWLREQMRSGVIIVGINTTRCALAAVLGLSPDGSAPGDTNAGARKPIPPGPEVASDPAWGWRHPSKPTFVLYYRAELPARDSAGQRSVVHREGSANEAYDPQQPTALFFLIRQAIQELQAPAAR